MSIFPSLEKTIIPASKLQAAGIPTASLAILEDGKITSHIITSGSEDTSTVYQACSISKAITGLAVAKLVDQRRLSYETKVIDHLSQSVIDSLVDEQTSHLLEHVTVGMLLSHTSGLSQHGFPGYPHSAKAPTPEDILAGRYPSNTPRVHFLTFPGMYWKYAGGGYVILQLVLEKITAQPFAQMMTEIVLKPLNMTRSWYGDLPAGEKNYTNGYYTGYTPCETGHHRLVEQAAAGLWTTPTDLLKATLAIQDSLHTSSGFLTTATAKKMLTQVAEAKHPGIQQMALGWFANDSAFSHTGQNYPGHTSYAFGFHGNAVNGESGREPSKQNHALRRSGFAIMTNSVDGHEAGIWSSMGAMFYLKKWPAYKTLSSQFGDDEYIPYPAPEDDTNTAVNDGWKEWIGTWDNDWRIVEENDGPGIAYKSFPVMKLRIAAAPVAELEKGKKEFLYVVRGLPIRVRLTWQADERVIEMRQKSEKTLKKT